MLLFQLNLTITAKLYCHQTLLNIAESNLQCLQNDYKVAQVTLTLVDMVGRMMVVLLRAVDG